MHLLDNVIRYSCNEPAAIYIIRDERVLGNMDHAVLRLPGRYHVIVHLDGDMLECGLQ
jgi:hypothetical protein